MDQYDDNKSTRNYLAVKWDKLNTEKYKKQKCILVNQNTESK